MLEAVIFDMDGVLTDSEVAYDEILQALMGEMGITISREEQLSFRAVPSSVTWETLSARYATRLTAQELWRREHEMIEARYERGEIPEVPYAFALLKELKRGGLKIAVATSNVRRMVRMVLERSGAAEFVDAISCVEDVENAKPAPDLFLNAARLLNVSPRNCVVVEDAPKGITGAKAAGMKVICYAAPTAPKLDHSEADLVVTSFEGLSRETFEDLIGATPNNAI